MKTIELTVDKNGKLVIDADGFENKECRNYIESILEAVGGKVESDTDKDDYARDRVKV